MNDSKMKTLLIIALPVLLLFIFLTVQVVSADQLAIDTYLDKGLTTSLSWLPQSFFVIMTEFGSKIGIGTISLLLLFWLWFKKKDYVGMAILVLAVAGGDQLNKLVKKLVGRERPSINEAVDALGFSFPSGHAMVGFIIYFMIIYFVVKEISNSMLKGTLVIAFSLLILLIGITRVMLDAHYPTDVIAGFSLGYLYIVFCLAIEKLLRNRLGKG